MEDPVAAARRELHELTILTSALLRLATKVQARCDTLRHTLGDTAPILDAEVDHHAPRDAGPTPPVRRAGVGEDEEPAALLAMSLAGQGLTRAQIGEYLKDSFEMQDTDALLDRVLPDQV